MITTNTHGRRVDTQRDEPTPRPVRQLVPVPTDYGVEGPYPAPIVIPWWAWAAGALSLCVIAGYVVGKFWR